DKSKRPLMGMAACEIADRVIVTSDNPRFENPLSIIEDIKVNIKNNPKLRCEADRREAIFSAISEAQKGDVVVIAGKGHENYQEINGIRNHFSDIEAATEAIKIRNSK
ncbi:MAG: UDP-N-acetylmuramyl-tripeptide synthetase, partial [uncultured bacterium]